MKLLASTGTRIFIVCWIVYSMHFATNVVREHYPAFSLIDSGSLKVDNFARFHPDIFKHTDGHWYINNNVPASVFAAIPLFVFKPILDMLEKHEKNKLKTQKTSSPDTRTDHKNSKIFLKLVREEGLSLRFGAATAITTVFLMAPLSALMVLLMYRVLCNREVTKKHAWWLSIVFAFATPLFFRTGVLNHNTMVMYATFPAFLLLWNQMGNNIPVSTRRRFWAGLLCGLGIALDYSGTVPLIAIYGYLIGSRLKYISVSRSIRESVPFIIGSIPSILFLLYTQWAMFGNPFLPGQYWMPDVTATPFDPNFVNPYSTDGFRGFSLPRLDLYFLNLFAPSYGMYTFGPLLLLGLIPVSIYKKNRNFAIPKPERIFIALYFLAFLTFCAANQFSRFQFNTGFRYMIPLVPLIFLAISDHLVRIPRKWLVALLIPVTVYSWIISMVREAPLDSWERILTSGLQLPWLYVLKSTAGSNNAILQNPLVPIAIIAFVFSLVAAIVWLGIRAERSKVTR